MIIQPGMAREAPPPAQESVCDFCDAQIVKVPYRGMFPTEHWDAVQPQPGVLFSMNCPSRPRPGMGSGSFDKHVPR
ncbi:hypothetical protein [Nonomuraea sp. NPDC048901]|uniref:hypothetical protein n=1 Tax=Nonomuraea sp. NPDC048901 TaxID=3155627 RepID=UPI0033CF8C36